MHLGETDLKIWSFWGCRSPAAWASPRLCCHPLYSTSHTIPTHLLHTPVISQFGKLKRGEKRFSVSWISHTAQAVSGQPRLNKEQWIKTLPMGLLPSWTYLRCIISLTIGCKELHRPMDAFLLLPGDYKLWFLVATQPNTWPSLASEHQKSP